MNISEQIRLKLQLKENNEVEYKSAAGGFPKAEFLRTFSAFANTNGGVIVLGVREKNNKFIPDGLTEEQIAKYRKEFWDDAHNKSCVSVPLLVESDITDIETEDGNKLIAFRIPRASYDLRPVYLTSNPFGHTFKRRHEGDYQCTDDEVRQMIADANIKKPADARILVGYTEDDIDLQTLHQYRRSYDSRHENHPWSEVSDEKFLENIGAYCKDRHNGTEGYTLAGILMFGKTNSITDQECCPYFFPDYRERLSDDPKIRWTNRIYPDGTWEANLYQFFTRVLPLLQHALPVPFKLDDNQQRIDKTTAHTALREAFANSLIHAVYSSMDNVVIDRYQDRIVISNPGSMLVSIKEFFEGNHSVCRNPLLKKMFMLIGVGEGAGSGADTIVKGWNDNGWEIPVIVEKDSPDRVVTTLIVGNKETEGGEKNTKDEEKGGEKKTEGGEKEHKSEERGGEKKTKGGEKEHKSEERGGEKKTKGGEKEHKSEERGGEKKTKGGEKETKDEERGGEKKTEGGERGGKKKTEGGERDNKKWGKEDALFEEKIMAKEAVLGIKLSETRKNILRLMYNNPTITTTEIMQILKINSSAVDKHIQSMRNVFLKNVGGRKFAKWQILLD